MAKAPSAAVLAARGRRSGQAGDSGVRLEWFVRKVSDKVSLSLKQRVGLATQFLLAKTVRNISRPVTKGTGPRGGKVVTNRSKAGEYPKAETTQLLKTTFQDVRKAGKDSWEGFVGTPLDYGVILETRLNRSFLKRTLQEEMPTIKRILTGPIK